MKKSRLSNFILIGAAGLSLLLLAVGRGNNSIDYAPTPGVTGITLDANEDRTASGNFAPDFTLNTLEGRQLSLSGYRGEKPVVLDFFATWCHNCRRNFPHEAGWYEKYKSQLEIIGVNLQENPAIVKRFVNESKATFPIVLDSSGLAARLYGVRYTNFKVLIDKSGSLVRSIPGDLRESDILSLIET